MNSQKLRITSENTLIKQGTVTDYNLECLVPNYAQVSRGDKLVSIVFSVQQGKCQCKKEVDFQAEMDGVWVQSDNADKIKAEKLMGSTIGTIFQDMDALCAKKYPCITHTEEDTFTHEKSIFWSKLAGFNLSGILLLENSEHPWLFIRCYYKERKIFLSFVFWRTLKKGDTLSLKFKDGKLLEFTLPIRPHKLATDYEVYDYRFTESFPDNYKRAAWSVCHISKGNAREVEFPLSLHDYHVFRNCLLSDIRITLNSEGGISEQNSIENGLIPQEVFPYALRSMFIKLGKAIEKNVPSFQLDIAREIVNDTFQEITFDYCYVYLMHDEANGYYKIGMSNDPTYREGTLQSEKPTIKLVATHKYPTRKIASAIETALHNVYRDNHVRGEWYRLASNDVLAIKETLG